MNSQKNTYTYKDMAAFRNRFLTRFFCVLLAVVAVGLSSYFIFREKYRITPQIRVEFEGGEWKETQDYLGRWYYAWHIPYDGKDHYPFVTIWDGDTKLNYIKGSPFHAGDLGEFSYSFRGDEKHLSCIKEKGTYNLFVDTVFFTKMGR
ncbi:MAG: hypothetical protein NC311_13470 [Muribaculaceae bacterium]|nr:hypothetical protein [Corallococcus sp.]MCM1296542.1 hypothetical protein [Muribaculaceae bacterium]